MKTLGRLLHDLGIRLGGVPLPVRRTSVAPPTAVDAYWDRHTVNSRPFRSARESLDYLEWRFREYPLAREFLGLFGDHDGEVVLDYGCGPGDDLVGFLVHSRARRVIGMDVSAKALGLAASRLSLHAIPAERVELLQVADAEARLPLPDHAVNYIHCAGVLHHTSHPEALLREFHRVLVPGAEARVMVYNRDSLWRHLYVVYERMILQGLFVGLDLEQAFARSTDGPRCPLSRCYDPGAFVAMCRDTGLEAEFVGGYLSKHELDVFSLLGHQAQQDRRLGEEHRRFLRELRFDERGLPRYRGRYAGIGGVYVLRKHGPPAAP